MIDLKKFRVSAYSLLLTLSLLWAYQPAALAETTTSDTTPTNPQTTQSDGQAQQIAGIDSLINGYGTEQQDLITNTPTYNIEQTMANGQSQAGWFPNNLFANPQAHNPAAQSGSGTGFSTADTKPAQARLDQQALANLLLTTDPDLTSQAILNALQLSDADLFSNPSASGSASPAKVDTFNFDSLIGPLTYTEQQATDARNFIQFVGNMAQPMRLLDFSSLSSNDREEVLSSNAAVREYLLTLRTYLAMQSVGINNFLQLYAERMPASSHSGSGSGSGSSAQQSNLSPLQADQQEAMRRINDPTWYTTMETASPIQVQRETLYLLAEMRLEMFKSRLATERLTAAISALELQQSYMMRQDIQQRVRAIEQQRPFRPQ